MLALNVKLCLFVFLLSPFFSYLFGRFWHCLILELDNLEAKLSS